MAKKRDYERLKERIAELAAKTKTKIIMPHETIELAEAREALRKHEAATRIKSMKAALAEGKKAALLKILDANGIKTEIDLKDILRFVQKEKPELIPARNEATEKPNADGSDKEKGDGGNATEQTEETKKENVDKGKGDTDSQTGEAPVCEKCGATAERRHAKKRDQDYFICPNYSKEDNGHLFQWF